MSWTTLEEKRDRLKEDLERIEGKIVKKDNPIKRLNVELPVALHNEFKELCIHNRRDIKEVVIRMITDHVNGTPEKLRK